MTKYFVDPHGVYLGGFDGAEPPAGAIEVPHPPEHGGQLWDGTSFVQPPVSIDEHNAPILSKLAEIDAKSIRPLREGETARVAELAAQAAALRAQLRK